jgi:nucleoside-diphosphate-sugar epimerase
MKSTGSLIVNPAVPRVLVTGAEGLVGSAVVAHLLACGHEITTLTRPDATPHRGVRVVRGDARDPAAVSAAIGEGGTRVDAVAHLAAIADPWHDRPHELFGNNVLATFTVLWTAAELGVRRLVIAGSVNATGLLVNPAAPLPASYPVDETTPADIADPYSLSKHVDEDTLRAVGRRFDASGVALRLPLMISPANEAELRAWKSREPRAGVGDGWGWLDVRDGAEAFRLALVGDYEGTHVVHVAAPDVFADRPTEDLLDHFAPNVPRREKFPGRTAPIDTTRAKDLLGFVARYGGPTIDGETLS